MGQVIREVSSDRIVNCDDAGWLPHSRGLLTWRSTGSRSAQAHIRGSEKDSVTVMASVQADGQKLPLQFLAKGQTERVYGTQVGDVQGTLNT